MKLNLTKGHDFEAQTFAQLEHLYCTALYMLDNESAAQELVQESFAKAYQSWQKCDFDSNRRVGLFRILANTLGDKYRPTRGLSHSAKESDMIAGHSYHSRLVERNSVDDCKQGALSTISKDDIRKAIGNLPDDYRLIVVLSLLENFSYREIADIAGTHLETVKSRIHQGRRLMQRELCDHVACESDYSMATGRVRSRGTG
jgi:RNA polymerase sigma-70 factor, ECF subfamily